MRQDFGKVLTERPRTGGKYNPKINKKTKLKINAQGEEDQSSAFPLKQSMTYFHNTKEFSDLISPLYRYLDKCIGQPYNQVYKDINQALGKGGLAQRHLMQHVKSYVLSEGIQILGDQVYSLEYGKRLLNNGQLYVDQQGIIRQAPQWKKNRKGIHPPSCFKPISPTTGYALWRNIWYQVEMRPVLTWELSGKMVPYNNEWTWQIYYLNGKTTYSDIEAIPGWPMGMVCLKKRQLSKKEIKKVI